MKSIGNVIGYLRTPLDLPVALFVASALVGVWASYDAATSWEKFALIVAAVVVYYGVVLLRGAPQMLSAFVWAFLIGCAALSVYFVTQNDYAAEPGKFGFITSLGLLLNRSVPQLAFHVPQANILAGALEIALPVGIAMVGKQWAVNREQSTVNREQSTVSREGSTVNSEQSTVSGKENALAGRKDNRLTIGLVVSVAVCLVIAFGLVMTSSRGAWLALGVVGVGAVAAGFARDVLKRYALPVALIGLLGFVIVVLRLGETLGPTIESVLGAVPAGGSAISRLELASQVWRLIQDYAFTGAGLGVFPMVYSTYTLLIDVPFLTHAHNLFLEVWLEQGLVGFVAFGWMIVEFFLWTRKAVNSQQLTANSEQRTVSSKQYAVSSRQSTVDGDQPIEMNWLMWGAVAAASVMLVHGFADVLLYSSRGLPLMLVPMGLAIASGQLAVGSRQSAVGNRQSAVGSRQSAVGTRHPAEDAGPTLRYGKAVGSKQSTVNSNQYSVNSRSARHSSRRSTLAIALVAMGALVLLVALTWNALAAMWYANLGSVAQTKAELGQYRWPDRLVGKFREDCRSHPAENAGPTLSSGITDCRLSEAEAYFRQALALDPGNVTANERLRALTLARVVFDVAQVRINPFYCSGLGNTMSLQLKGRSGC